MIQTDFMDLFNQAKNYFDIILGEKKVECEKLLMKKSIHYNYYVQLVE